MAIGIGAFIALAVLAAIWCARAGSGLGSVFFFGLALVLFISTPMGSDLPGTVMDFVSGVGQSSGPTLRGSEQ